MHALAALTAPGGPEIVIILVLFILLFGAKKLPELGSSVGKSIKNFKSGMREARDEDDGGDAAEASEGAAPASRDPQ